MRTLANVPGIGGYFRQGDVPGTEQVSFNIGYQIAFTVTYSPATGEITGHLYTIHPYSLYTVHPYKGDYIDIRTWQVGKEFSFLYPDEQKRINKIIQSIKDTLIINNNNNNNKETCDASHP